MNWTKMSQAIAALLVTSRMLTTSSFAEDLPTAWADITQGATLPAVELEEVKALFLAGKTDEARAIVVQYETQRMAALQAADAARRANEVVAALAEENVALAEEKRLQARPYDCLAGLCLNTKLPANTKSIATVAEHKWQRDVEVCSGRVVDITLQATWAPSEITIVDMLPQAVTKTYTDGSAAVATMMQVQAGLHAKGWMNQQPTSTLFSETAQFANNDIRGQRTLLYDKSTDYMGTTWSIMLYTRHEAYADLCKDKHAQGL